LPHSEFFHQLKTTKAGGSRNAQTRQKVRALLSKANQKQIKSLCECILNVVNGNIPITSHHVKNLKPYQNTIYKVVSKRVPIKSKKKLLVQKGSGFVPVIATIVGSLLAKLLK
jgi:hypothetical protein